MSRWIKFRKPISDYPETNQQKKVKLSGKVIGKVCTGKEKEEFYACRSDVLACLFGKDDSKCSIEILNAKEEAKQ